MGKLTNGLAGGFRGRLGNVIGYELNGQNVIRSAPRHPNRKFSAAQLATQRQLALLCQLFRNAGLLLKNGFGHLANHSVRNYYNLAVRYNRPCVAHVSGPEMGIDYSKVQWSSGNLDVPIHPEVEVVNGGLQFNWDYAADSSGLALSDQVMLLALVPGTDVKWVTQSGARRVEKSDLLLTPGAENYEQLETYISFVADNRLQAANSVYLGTIAI